MCLPISQDQAGSEAPGDVSVPLLVLSGEGPMSLCHAQQWGGEEEEVSRLAGGAVAATSSASDETSKDETKRRAHAKGYVRPEG